MGCQGRCRRPRAGCCCGMRARRACWRIGKAASVVSVGSKGFEGFGSSRGVSRVDRQVHNAATLDRAGVARRAVGVGQVAVGLGDRAVVSWVAVDQAGDRSGLLCGLDLSNQVNRSQRLA
jgi:hypothetical protein